MKCEIANSEVGQEFPAWEATHAASSTGWLKSTIAGAIAGALVLFTGISTIVVGYQQSSRAFHEEVRENLVQLAQAAASQVDGDLHQRISDRSQQESVEYRRAVQPLREMLGRIKGVKYIYTAVRRDDRIYFILDAAQAGDADGDGRDDQAKIMEEYTDPDAAMVRCFQTGRDAAAASPYKDEWGWFVTGFAWFKDRQGQPVGVVGVDVTAEEYQTRLSTMRRASAFAMIPALLIALATAVGVSVSSHVRWHARRFRQQAEHELRQQASVLLAANTQLLEARARAQLANDAKSDFLANMSHEIRTPMTAIMGYAELLRSECAADEGLRKQAIATICRNGEHLLSIVNDILDLSKIEAGRVELDTVGVVPTELLQEVTTLMQVRADEKQLELKSEWVGRCPSLVWTDVTRLRQILINLLGNAIKFTDLGRVTIRGRLVSGDHESLEFDLIDTGIGMTDDQASRLFCPFTQADSSMTRRFGGTGLGLSISKRFAQMLGGDVELIRTAPGAGSHFRATVRVRVDVDAKSACDPRATPKDDGTKLKRQERELNPTDEDNPGLVTPPKKRPAGSPTTPGSEGQRPLSGASILLAEDGIDNQRLIAFMLRKAGAEVTIVDDGQQALELAWMKEQDHEPFNLILMDMQMPVLDGYQATDRLRQLGYRRPIMALTAHAMAGDREKCLVAGCDDYATKPIERSRLIEQVAALLSMGDRNSRSDGGTREAVACPPLATVESYDETQVHSLTWPQWQHFSQQ